MTEAARPEDHLPPATVDHGDPDAINATLRAAEAMRLRGLGMSWEQISTQQGYSERNGSRKLVERYAQALLAEQAEHMRATWNETHRLQLASAAAIMDDPNADALTKLRANDTITRIARSSAKLHGLDAPIRIEVGDAARAAVEQALSLLEDTVLGEVSDVYDEPPDDEGEAQAL